MYRIYFGRANDYVVELPVYSAYAHMRRMTTATTAAAATTDDRDDDGSGGDDDDNDDNNKNKGNPIYLFTYV